MLLKRLALAAMIAVLSLRADIGVKAQDAQISQQDLQQLVERLQAAEARIGQLETERKEEKPTKPPQFVPTSAALPATPAAGVGRANYSPGTAKFRRTNATDDALMSRLENLENRWVDLDSAISNAVTEKASAGNLQLEGRIHLDYWAFPRTDGGTETFEGSGNPFTPQNPQDRFTTRRMRLGFKGNIKDNMVYTAQLEFAGVDDPEFRDLYIGFKDLPWFQTLLIGNQKRPYGLDHLNSSRFNVFLERPFIIESFNEDARRIGITSYGVSKDQAWNWRYGVYNMEKAHPDGQYVGDHYQLEVAGRLANTAWYDECTDGRNYIHWAVAGTIAHPDGTGGPTNRNESRFRTRPEARTTQRWLNTDSISGANTYALLALESVVNLGPTQIVGEWQNIWLDRTAGRDVNIWGGYLYWSYFLTGEHIPWSRKNGTIGRVKPFQNFFLVNRCGDCVDGGWGAWNVGVRYSYADFNDEDILGGIGESLTFALNWHWNSQAKLQLNYVVGRIEDRAAAIPALTTGDYQILGARFAVDF